MYFFSHIPKTAGTSLRVALESQSDILLLNDYGEHSPYTSPAIIEHYYQNRDLKQLAALNAFALFGHVPVKRYLSIVHPSQVISFVREPVARIVSEYRHCVRNQDYAGSLIEFAQQKRLINSMSKFLNGAPWSTFGFIGLSERYNDSLRLLGPMIGRELPVILENAAPKEDDFSITEAERNTLIELNQIDIELYHNIQQQFEWRVDRLEEQEFVHAGWQVNTKNHAINGFAYTAQNQQGVEVSIMRRGNLYKKLISDKGFGIGRRFNIGQDGHIGFSVPLNGHDPAEFQIQVAATGQPVHRLDARP